VDIISIITLLSALNPSLTRIYENTILIHILDISNILLNISSIAFITTTTSATHGPSIGINAVNTPPINIIPVDIISVDKVKPIIPNVIIGNNSVTIIDFLDISEIVLYISKILSKTNFNCSVDS
jgi:hypothetical protein